MERCNDCIHEKVCLHRANIQTDTYAYMGIKYDTEKCEHFAADVVPKSEVEQLKRNLAQCENGYSQEMHLLRCKLTNAKAEVAKEIFQEIEREVEIQDRLLPTENLIYLSAKIAELKKKYTEEKTDEHQN